MMTNPWDRNAGKYDRPSSTPNPTARNPTRSRPDRTPIYDSPEAYRGVQSIKETMEKIEALIETVGPRAGKRRK